MTSTGIIATVGTVTKFSISAADTVLSTTRVKPELDNTTTLGVDAQRWSDIYSVDGSFSGNLNTEVGGSNRVYNLGTDGDTDTEYLELRYDSNEGVIDTVATGSGATRDLLFKRDGVTKLELSANVTSHVDLRPLNNNAVSCGAANKRWYATYSKIIDASGDVVMAANVDCTGLPTSDPVVAGRLWNHNDTVKISAG